MKADPMKTRSLAAALCLMMSGQALAAPIIKTSVGGDAESPSQPTSSVDKCGHMSRVSKQNDVESPSQPTFSVDKCGRISRVSKQNGVESPLQPMTGVGALSIEKKAIPGRSIFANYTISAGTQSCPSGCTIQNFNTGAGFIQLQSSRPVHWRRVVSGNEQSIAGCGPATTACTVLVANNEQVQMVAYPACFDQDSASAGSTCTPHSSELGNVYGTNNQVLGAYAGNLGSKHLITTRNDEGSFQWGCYGTRLGATSSDDGQVNTNAILANSCSAGSTAARVCANKGPGWYLPAAGELNVLYTNRDAIGGFSTNYYWSSTEFSSNGAWYLYFGDGTAWYFFWRYFNDSFRNGYHYKYTPLSVRCVRSL